jgi:hypothetical protein
MKPKVQFDFWGLFIFLWFPAAGFMLGCLIAFPIYYLGKKHGVEEAQQQPPSLTDPITPEEIENRRPTANP